MVGLSLAIMLAEHGVAERILVLDRQPLNSTEDAHFLPSFDDRVTALSPSSVDIFREFACWPRVQRELQSIEGVEVSDRGRPGFVRFGRTENGAEAVGYTIENRRLGEQLLRHAHTLEPVHLLGSMNVAGITMQAKGARLALDTESGPRQLSAGLVVLAEGANPSLCRALGIVTHAHDYAQRALIANLSLSCAHEGIAYERFTEQGPLALLPMTSLDGVPRAALVWTLAATQAEHYEHCSPSAFLSALEALLPRTLLGRCRGVGQRSSYPILRHTAAEQVRSSLVLVGNSAHTLHPVAGQGFNLALRDCAELLAVLSEAKKKGEALGHLSVLLRYARRREGDQWLTSELTHRFVDLFVSDNAANRAMRDLALLALQGVSPIKHRFFAQMMGRPRSSP